MPMIQTNGCAIHVAVEGPADAPALVLSNSLGADHTMWNAQVAPLARHFRLIRYDCRGHGRSQVTPGPITIAQLGRDALGILDALAIERAHWCGISMGGMVGQWLAANAPERIGKLVLANTSSYLPNKQMWNDRIATIREKGLGAIVDAVMAVWFTDVFRAREPETVAAIRASFVATPIAGYIACGEAVRDMDQREMLAAISAPTLVIAGRYDMSTPLDAAEFIRARIEGAQLTILEAAHLSNVEQSAAFSGEVSGFLLS